MGGKISNKIIIIQYKEARCQALASSNDYITLLELKTVTDVLVLNLSTLNYDR